MRLNAGLTAFSVVALFSASSAWAEEAVERSAIGAVIASLNEPAQPNAVFTSDGDGASELARLRKANPALRIIGPSEASAPMPTMTISHEPWGEARINFPPMESRTVERSITFVSPDVALAEGAYTYQDSFGVTQTIPLLFVMKKQGEDWKIASLRVLAPR